MQEMGMPRILVATRGGARIGSVLGESSLRFVAVPIALLLTLLAARGAEAHRYHSPPGQEEWGWWETWNLEPWLVALLFLSACAYGWGLAALWRSSGLGRGLPRWRPAMFYAGWLALVLALLSPLDALGEQLFSMHMLQHELLMLVAAPLLVLGKPLAVFAWGLPLRDRQAVGGPLRTPWWQRIWRTLTAPLTAWSLHAIVLWGWHAPALFQASLASDAIHNFQHATFLSSALLFWWALVRRRPDGTAVLYVFTTLLHTGFLGALLTFSPSVLYPDYIEFASRWDTTALADQQLGGLIMWVPAGAILLLSGLLLLAQWLRAIERRSVAAVAGKLVRQ